jgi:hypothetical protein
MTSIERYRRYALECFKLAQAATTEGDKVLLLQMAETWREIAARAEAQIAQGENDRN